jgi:uncharacterized membrane protein YkgB
MISFAARGESKDRRHKILVKLSVLKEDRDYHLIRASMLIIYFFFGYQKWFDYEAQGLIPFFTHGPLIFWMYPVLGSRAHRNGYAFSRVSS